MRRLVAVVATATWLPGTCWPVAHSADHVCPLCVCVLCPSCQLARPIEFKERNLINFISHWCTISSSLRWWASGRSAAARQLKWPWQGPGSEFVLPPRSGVLFQARNATKRGLPEEPPAFGPFFGGTLALARNNITNSLVRTHCAHVET